MESTARSALGAMHKDIVIFGIEATGGTQERMGETASGRNSERAYCGGRWRGVIYVPALVAVARMRLMGLMGLMGTRNIIPTSRMSPIRSITQRVHSPLRRFAHSLSPSSLPLT